MTSILIRDLDSSVVLPPREICEVELNLIPPVVESHGHRADEGFNSGCGLVIGGSEPSPHILVVQNLQTNQNTHFRT